ncbi:hypothetical protein E2C01_048637 [Portunus trituberculatus]|uniref:Uncharacterized protein n=1 Tax=Portunus trituberculatus TaxID=210409 RepID=A0A5B7G6Z4_PORTR|nr:hypothetical protein [Portunus trituberculatus]
MVLRQVEVSGNFSRLPPQALRHMFPHNRSSFPIWRQHLATRDPEGGNGIPSDVMSVLLGSDIEDSDEAEDSDFSIEKEESEDSSSDSDSDLGDRDQPS